MSVVVVDCRDTARLPGVAAACGAEVQYTSRKMTAAIRDAAPPRLALWHVGYEQNRADSLRLRVQLDRFLAAGDSWVAAYTGGQILEDLLPAGSDHFAVRDDAGADEAPTGDFLEAIRRVSTHWVHRSGFAPGELKRLWLGRDPVADAKPALLNALGAGHEPPEEARSVLRGVYPTIDAHIEAVRRGTPGALEALWRLLFR